MSKEKHDYEVLYKGIVDRETKTGKLIPVEVGETLKLTEAESKSAKYVNKVRRAGSGGTTDHKKALNVAEQSVKAADKATLAETTRADAAEGERDEAVARAEKAEGERDEAVARAEKAEGDLVKATMPGGGK